MCKCKGWQQFLYWWPHCRHGQCVALVTVNIMPTITYVHKVQLQEQCALVWQCFWLLHECDLTPGIAQLAIWLKEEAWCGRGPRQCVQCICLISGQICKARSFHSLHSYQNFTLIRTFQYQIPLFTAPLSWPNWSILLLCLKNNNPIAPNSFCNPSCHCSVLFQPLSEEFHSYAETIENGFTILICWKRIKWSWIVKCQSCNKGQLSENGQFLMVARHVNKSVLVVICSSECEIMLRWVISVGFSYRALWDNQIFIGT